MSSATILSSLPFETFRFSGPRWRERQSTAMMRDGMFWWCTQSRRTGESRKVIQKLKGFQNPWVLKPWRGGAGESGISNDSTQLKNTSCLTWLFQSENITSFLARNMSMSDPGFRPLSEVPRSIYTCPNGKTAVVYVDILKSEGLYPRYQKKSSSLFPPRQLLLFSSRVGRSTEFRFLLFFLALT